jgi:uncharacterized Ntn-hydrolase superfamily protein
MTFSIIARSADASEFGMAIASSSPAVAARCVHARAGVGVVASQNVTDPALGTRTLEALARGLAPAAALAEVLAATPFGAYRQLLALGGAGPPAIHSGERALGRVGAAAGRDAAAAGNLLARDDVPIAMLAAFDAAQGHLGTRLLAALEGGLAHGGEAGPIHSAGLMVVREVAWPIVDLRIDWADRDPLEALRRLWTLYAPQMDAYVQRALDPRAAPSYGVPGDP